MMIHSIQLVDGCKCLLSNPPHFQESKIPARKGSDPTTHTRKISHEPAAVQNNESPFAGGRCKAEDQAEAAGGRRGVLLVRALRTIFVDEPSVERRIGS